jgi:hypothetical protein
LTEKTCSMCKKALAADQFYADSSKKDGLCSRCMECNREAARQWKAKNLTRRRQTDQAYLCRQHGITPERWDAIFAAQGGRCAACGEENQNNRQFHIDHDHECCPGSHSCGKCIRGLLCHHCNVALGHVKDDLDRLQRLAEYVLSTRNVLHIVA